MYPANIRHRLFFLLSGLLFTQLALSQVLQLEFNVSEGKTDLPVDIRIELTSQNTFIEERIALFQEKKTLLIDSIAPDWYAIHLDLLQNGKQLFHGFGRGEISREDTTYVSCKLKSLNDTTYLLIDWTRKSGGLKGVSAIPEMIDTSGLKLYAIPNPDSLADLWLSQGMPKYNKKDVNYDYLDVNLIPTVTYAFGSYRNPVAIGLMAYAFYEDFQRTKLPRDERGFLNNARWLAENHDYFYYYHYPFQYSHAGRIMEEGWVSGMAQGNSLGVVSLAAQLPEITQQKHSHYLHYVPDPIILPYDSGERVIALEASLDWTILSDSSWYSIDILGDSAFRIEYIANESYDEREARIEFETVVPDFTFGVHIIQQSTPYFRVGVDTLFVTEDSMELQIMVESNRAWASQHDSTWIASEIMNDSTLLLRVSRNQSPHERSATIQILSEEPGFEHEITLIQESMVVLSIYPQVVVLLSREGEFSLHVYGNRDWIASSKSRWLSIEERSDSLVRISYLENSDTIDREDSISIILPDENISKKVSVIQKGLVLSVDMKADSRLHVYPNPARNLLYVEHRFPEDGILEIVNTRGQVLLVKAIDARSRTELDVSVLSTGLYLLRYKAGRQVFTGKLLIQD